MSMTKEQFIAQVVKMSRSNDIETIATYEYLANEIWDNLLYEGNQSMKVKPYYEFMTDEEKAEVERERERRDEERRLAIREATIQRQMDRTGQDRETVERLMP